MGLVGEVQELKYTIKRKESEQEKLQKKVDELQKKLDMSKQKNQNQKEYERDLKKAVENDLKSTFCKCFDRDGLEKGYINLTLKATRDEILNNVPENEMEWQYVNDNYEKILNKVKKIYENDQKAKEKLQKIAILQEWENGKEEREKQSKKEKRNNTINNILLISWQIMKWILIILFFGIYFIWKVIIGIANKS